MGNDLSIEKRDQVVALELLGWALQRIEAATGVRRETASGYLRAAGIAVRPPGGWGRRAAKPANAVTTDPEAGCAPADGPAGVGGREPAARAGDGVHRRDIGVGPTSGKKRIPFSFPMRHIPLSPSPFAVCTRTHGRSASLWPRL